MPQGTPFIESFIQRCCECCPNINDYFLERRYIGDVESREDITPSYLYQQTLSLLIGELQELGLECNNLDALQVDTNLPNALLLLRHAFDTTYFLKLLKSLDEKNYSILESQVELIEDPADYLLEITNILHELLPHDMDWERLVMWNNEFMSDARFAAHINALFKSVNDQLDQHTPLVSEDKLADYTNFLQEMQRNINYAKRIVAAAIDRYPSKSVLHIQHSYLQKASTHYDHEKLHPAELLDKFVEYYAKGKPKPEPEFVLQHHLKSDHHIEHYIGNPNAPIPLAERSFPTKGQGVMILIGLYLDGLSTEQVKAELIKLKRNEDDASKLAWLIELAETNIWYPVGTTPELESQEVEHE